jgi:hypothetical protein
MDMYLGPPELIIHDTGTQFTSVEFTQNTELIGSVTKYILVEAHYSIGIVERYHIPLRRAYEIITKELPQTTKQYILQMAVKAVNDTAGPDGLVPTLLVFGTFPRMSIKDTTTTTVVERGKAIRKAMKEVAELHAKRHVTEALRTRNGPNISDVLDLAIGEKVLVYRENKGWDGPHTMLSVDGHNCVVKLPAGPTTFRITSVKKYFVPPNTPQDNLPSNLPSDQPVDPPNTTQPPVIQPIRQNLPRHRRVPTRYREIEMMDIHMYLSHKEDEHMAMAVKLRKEGIIRSLTEPFVEARKKEIDGLLSKNVFQIVNIRDIPRGERLFRSRFVDEVKRRDGVLYKKSRLVVQAHHDRGKQTILTQSLTIQRAS